MGAPSVSRSCAEDGWSIKSNGKQYVDCLPFDFIASAKQWIIFNKHAIYSQTVVVRPSEVLIRNQ